LTVKAEDGADTRPATAANEDVEVLGDPGPGDGRRRRRQRTTVKAVCRRATAGGPDDGVERESPVGVPRYRLARADDFERPWHLAAWLPHDPQGPTVYVNQDSPILHDVVEYHRAQYPDVYAEEVATTVYQVFGEVAVCKVAHAQKLVTEVAEEELDRDYRSEPALTVALMGLMAEESRIAQRLGKLGRKKTLAPASAEGTTANG
jgi:hypothetical protein